MRDKKMVLMPLLLMLALGMSGVAFAHWSGHVYVQGTVKMGTLTLAFDYVEPPLVEEFHWNDLHTQLVAGEYKGKNVGNSAAWYSDVVTDKDSGKMGYKTLNIEENNAYPQYVVHTTFKLHNIGTIPLNIENYEITGEKRDNTGAVVYNLLWYDPDHNYIGSLWEDVNNNGVVDPGTDKEVILLEITNSLPYQIDPCNTNKAEIDMELTEDAEQCHTYTIHVTVNADQWAPPV